MMNMYRMLSVLFVIAIYACSTTAQDLPGKGADQNGLRIPATENTQHLKNFERITVYAETPPWTITNTDVDKGDFVLIFASGKAKFGQYLDPAIFRLFIKIEDHLSFIIPKNPSYFSTVYSGRLKFATGHSPKTKTPEVIDSIWYRNNSGSYRVDIFVIAASNEMYLPAALNDVARSNRKDEIFQSQVKAFNGPTKAELKRETADALKSAWFRTVHYSGRIKIIDALSERKETNAIFYCFNNVNKVGRPIHKMDHLSFIRAFGKLKDSRAVEKTGDYVLDPDPDIKTQALNTLGQIKDADNIEKVFPALNDKNPNLRWKAIHILGEIGNPKAAERISLLLADDDAMVRDSAESVLRQLGVSNEKIQGWKNKAEKLVKQPLTLDEVYRAKFEYQKAVIEKEELQAKLQSETDVKKELEGALNERELALKNKQQLVESLYENERELKSKFAQLNIAQQQSEEYQAELQRLNAKVQSLNAELKQAKTQTATENVQQELDKILEAKSKLEQESQNSQKKESMLRDEITGLNALAEKTRLEAEAAKKEVVALRNREKQLTTQVDELKQRLDRSLAPVLVVSKPINGSKIESPNTLLHFIAVDDKGIRDIDVSLNGNPVKIDRQRGLKVVSTDRKFSKKIDIVEKLQLQKGQNIIKITVVDIDGVSQEELIQVTRVKSRGHIWAIVIGINQYRNTRNLKYAVNDARAFKGYLKEYVGIPDERIFYLENQNATRDNIQSLLGTQLKRKASKEDTVIIFYAGHGAVETDPSNPDGDGFEKYLLPYDADLNDLYTTSISMDEIRKIFQRIRADRLIFIADTCYSGASGGRTMMASKTRANLSDKFYERISKGKGRVIISSCSANEISKEDDSLKHGVFSYYMLEGLKGRADQDADGIITVSELFSYISRKVPAASAQDQHPVKKGETEGELVIGRVK